MVFSLQPLEFFPLACGESFTLSRIALRLADPFPKRFRRAADLCRDGRDSRPLRFGGLFLFFNQPDCPFPHFW
jgi:hypothetical protein